MENFANETFFNCDKEALIMTLFSKKGYIILTIVVAMIIGLLAFYFISVSDKMLDIKIDEVKVFDIREFSEDEETLKERGVSSEQIDDILKHPENYRIILHSFEFKNHSKIAGAYDFRVKPKFSDGIQKRLVWTDQVFHLPPFILPSETKGDMIYIMVKMEEDDTDEKLLKMAKKDNFIITGQKASKFFEHGPISIKVESMEK